MRGRHTQRIIPFPFVREDTPRRHPAGKGVVVPLHETQPDKTWDALTELASEAWSWRDPESLARLEGCIRRLWAEVERDWHSSD